jgi:hypothetical protein
VEEEQRYWRLENDDTRTEGTKAAAPATPAGVAVPGSPLKASHKPIQSPYAAPAPFTSTGPYQESPSDAVNQESSPVSLGHTMSVGPQVKFNGVSVTKPTPSMPPMAAMPSPMPEYHPMPQYQMKTTASVMVQDIKPATMTDTLCALHDCGCQCERLIAWLSVMPDAHAHAHHIRTLDDCADLCHMTWCFLQRNSRYSLKLCKLCAQVCAACASNCALYPDVESQRCAAYCLRTAAVCRGFIASHS